ncbi:leishmanolysin-like peptidase [Homalodisca vitripennis]|nr:leishmanolysin-like peptidase [Homalodisca vitripennis]
MAVKVKWKCHCVVLVMLFSNIVSGMFTRRHCSHHHPKPHEVVHGVHIEPAHVMKKRSVDQPLRILLYYDESVYR